MLLTILLGQGSAGPSNVTLTQNTRFDNSGQFFAATVGRGAVTLSAARFDNAGTFYAPTVTTFRTLDAVRFDNASTYYTPTVGRGSVGLTASRLDNSQTFYAATITQSGGTQTLLPDLYTNSPAFYAAQVNRTLAPARYDNTATFYAATVSRGPVTLTPARYDSASTFYGPTVGRGAITLSPARFDGTQTFYAHNLRVVLSASLLSNTNTFYGGSVSGSGVQALIAPLLTNTSQFFTANTALYLTFPDWVEPGWVEPGWVEWPYFNRQTFFAPAVTSVRNLTPALFSDGDTFYQHLALLEGYPNPADVTSGVVYGPGGIYAGTKTGGGQVWLRRR